MRIQRVWIATAMATLRIIGLPSTAASSQGPSRVTVVREGPVDEGLSEASFAEPAIAANVNDPKHLIVAAMRMTARVPFDTSQRCAIYVSRDAGLSWRLSAQLITHCGDPWLVATPTGSVTFSGLAPGGEILVYRSRDGGTTWPTAPTSLGRGYDHPSMAIGPAPRSGAPNPIYIAADRGMPAVPGTPMGPRNMRFAVTVARSDDDAVTFARTPPVQPSNSNFNVLAVSVLADGTLIVPFFDFMRNVDGFQEKGRLERPRAWVLTSVDRGASFGPPLMVSEECVSGGGFPTATASGSVGPSPDRLYVACATRRGLAVLASADRGETWTDPVHFAIDSVSPPPRVSRAIALAVNRAGVLGVVWMDRREDRAGKCQNLYFAASTDGAASFSPPVKVSRAPSCPAVLPDSAIAMRFAGSGDYGTLTASADGLFHTAWADARDARRLRLWTASIRVDAP